MMTGDMDKTDPVCSKSPDHHLIQEAIERAKHPKNPLLERVNKRSIKDADIVQIKL